ncbi:MAG: hypothetical protein GW938_09740 [Leptospira sp.]|nr:hypothetical protein [Leptospira sp.]NCS95553.1 hypothetical protein [Leptospira sp.]
MQILISDELINGTVSNQFNIEIEDEEITIEKLIEMRVCNEVENYNKKLPEYFQGLVEPTESESTLNGYKLKKYKMIDAEKQVYLALAAFQKNSYFVLVDDIQIENLNQKIRLDINSKISFIKLTPLVGG